MLVFDKNNFCRLSIFLQTRIFYETVIIFLELTTELVMEICGALRDLILFEEF